MRKIKAYDTNDMNRSRLKIEREEFVMRRYVKLLCMLLTVAVLLTGLKMIVVSAQSKDDESKTESVQVLENSSETDIDLDGNSTD